MRWSVVTGVVLLVAACSSPQLQSMPNCPPDCPLSDGTRLLGRQPATSPIVLENSLPGDPRWRSGVSAREGELDLYVTRDSLEVGESFSVRIHGAVPATVDLTIFRIGHYGGAGARRIELRTGVAIGPQPECPLDTTTGLIECPWNDTATFTVGGDWVSGLYVVRAMRADKTFRLAPFVVRDRRAAELLFIDAHLTSQAYNRWGGVSLYGDSTGRTKHRRATVVSHDRPFREADGAGQMIRWQADLARFLEERGYDVTYVTNDDFARFDDMLVGIGMVVHGGHDEYWVRAQREQLDRALSEGRVSLGHFGANGGYWRVRLDAGPDGRPERRVACFKNAPQDDPTPGSTARFRDEPDPLPENALFGGWYVSYQVLGFPLVVGDAANWVFSGTTLVSGDVLPGLLGYEFDRRGDNGLTPEGTHVVMDSPTLTTTGLPEHSEMLERVEPSGRVVFSAGSIYFPTALAKGQRDDRVARLVENVLERGLSHRRTPRVPDPPGPARFVTGPTVYERSVRVEPLVEGLQGPTALAVLPSGALVVAETGRDRIRILENGQLLTLAGDGLPGDRDGAAAQARFRQPTGLAVLTDGSIVVADQLNRTVRRLFETGSGWQVETLAGEAGVWGSNDGTTSEARFMRPAAVAVGQDGSIFVVDQEAARVRRIDLAVDRVETLAGSGALGFDDASDGLRATFREPSAIAVAPEAIYLYDAGNGSVRAISRTPPHAVVTLAGSGPGSFGMADGTGSEARFRGQLGLVFRPNTSDVFIADGGNYRLRRIVPGPSAAETQVSTVVGTGRLGTALGDGESTDLGFPTGVAVLPDGSLAVTDSALGVIRRVVLP